MAVYYARSVKWVKSLGADYKYAEPNVVNALNDSVGSMNRASMPISLAQFGLVDASESRKHFISSILAQLGISSTITWQRTGKVIDPSIAGIMPKVLFVRAVYDPNGINTLSNASFGWSVTRHVGHEVVNTLSNAVRWANFFVGEGTTGAIAATVVPILSRNFSIVSTVNACSLANIFLSRSMPSSILCSSIYETSAAWRTMQPRERTLLTGVISDLAAAWVPLWVISDPALIAIAENPIAPVYIRLATGSEVMGVQALSTFNTMHYAVSRENLVDIYSASRISSTKVVQGEELVALTSTGVMIPMRWLSQEDSKTSQMQAEDDDVHAWVRQEDGTLVPMKMQEMQMGTFHPQDDKQATWRH